MAKRITMQKVLQELESRKYYWTVAEGFIIEAIYNSVQDNGGAFNSIDELDAYIRANYI